VFKDDLLNITQSIELLYQRQDCYREALEQIMSSDTIEGAQEIAIQAIHNPALRSPRWPGE